MSPASLPSLAAKVTAVGRPRATSAAKLGPDRIAGTRLGRAFGDHLAHELFAAALDAFGADDQRRACRKQWRERRCDGAHGLGGNDQEDRLGGDGSGEIAGNDDTVVDADAGQEPAFALGLQCFRIGGVLLPTA